MTPEIIPGFVLLSIMFVGGIWCRSKEKKTWNKGICASNGMPWKYFGTDSQGGRGYKAGDKIFWASYRVDTVKLKGLS